MSIWWAIPAFVALVGVMSLIGGLGRLFSARLMTGGTRILFGGVLLAGAAVVGLVGLNLQTYARLTHERLAAEVALRRTGENAYVASVARANADGVLQRPEEFPLTGDSFRIEADVITFKPWANIIGADALYRFDRIQGRWASAAQENAALRSRTTCRQRSRALMFSTCPWVATIRSGARTPNSSTASPCRWPIRRSMRSS